MVRHAARTGARHLIAGWAPASDGAELVWYATHSWRAWLMTGARRVPIDPRRARGSDSQIKSILLGGPSGAVDFSSAMARQAIDEAMSQLPTRDRQVVKLAYFGGLTNREIADQVGLTRSGVRRRLRLSLAIISVYVSRGRAIARSAVHGLALWLYLRFGGGTQRLRRPILNQIQQAGIVAVVGFAAAALFVADQTSPGHVSLPHTSPSIAAVGPPGSIVTAARRLSPSLPSVAGMSLPAAVPSLPVKLQIPALLRVRLPVRVRLPALPALPVKVQLPVKPPINLPVALPALPPAPKVDLDVL